MARRIEAGRFREPVPDLMAHETFGEEYQIVEAVHMVLEKTPPELAADISDRGIVLTGGGALLTGLEQLLEERLGITTMTAEEPTTCVAVGTGKYIEVMNSIRD